MGRGNGATAALGGVLLLALLVAFPVSLATSPTGLDEGQPSPRADQTDDGAQDAWGDADETFDAAADEAQRDAAALAPDPAAALLSDQIESWQRFKDDYDSRPLPAWLDELRRDAEEGPPLPEVPDAEAPPLPKQPDAQEAPLPSPPRQDDLPDAEGLQRVLDVVFGGGDPSGPSADSAGQRPGTVAAPILTFIGQAADALATAAHSVLATVGTLLLALVQALGSLFGAGSGPGPEAAEAAAALGQNLASAETALAVSGFALAGYAATSLRGRRAWLLLRRGLLGLGLPLLSRITPDRILEHEARRKIHDIVRLEPGISLNGIVAHLALSRNAVAYHLAVFESEHEIVSLKDGKYRRYFLNGGKYVNGAKDVVATLRNEKTLRVAQFILGHPGSIQKDLCAAVGTSPSATNWHIARLERVRLISKARAANTVRYFAGEAMRKYDLAEFGLFPEHVLLHAAAGAPAPSPAA